MKLFIPVLYEDQHLLVVDKPEGLIVNDSKTSGESTLQAWVKENRPALISHEDMEVGDPESEFREKSGIVHRLDKDTSGILLIAKDVETFGYLQGLFKKREVEKVYQVVVYGHVPDKEFEIDAPISRDPRNRLRYAVVEEGREAQTRLKVIKYEDDAQDSLKGLSTGKSRASYTYLEAYPKTGRTHQIRVHLKTFGFPVAGDPIYAPRNIYAVTMAKFGRLMLHAKKITFPYYQGKMLTIESKTTLF